ISAAIASLPPEATRRSRRPMPRLRRAPLPSTATSRLRRALRLRVRPPYSWRSRAPIAQTPMARAGGHSIALTTFLRFAIPPTAGYVEVTVGSNLYMAVGQFHDLSDGVLLMHGVIREINGTVITFENVPREDGDTSGRMSNGEVDPGHHAPIVTPGVPGLV